MSTKNSVSVLTFRVNIPDATPAITPVIISLNPPSPALHELEIYFVTVGGAAHDVNKAGWRMRNNGVLILPENGSGDDPTFAYGAKETGWAGMPQTDRINLNFHGRELEGTPFNLNFEFYNVEGHAYQAIGFLTIAQPMHTIHDLVVDLRRYQEKIEPVIYNREVNATGKQLTDAPYPEMRQGKK